ncbi:hypothetical protein [Pelagicoccus sp. SDUM812003]|uniref:hypothetical protein n=1 Tax=Pelagicoccus sp. SDUM812003 TaxID=3041267 RepID=UPI00280C4D34|nr:hypothetical protein [Pelagicoccus sp. SDUM812003]MDQ8204032.1 hypothetical protein [Pelagicoccus sp. SDUM812003]
MIELPFFKALLTLACCLALSPLALCQEAEPLWTLKTDVRGPETILYDAKRDLLLVSNFDLSTPNEELGTDFITCLELEGRIAELKWLDGLSSPLGMEIFQDKLYIAERWGIHVVDIETKTTVDKIPTPDAVFLNDLSLTADGVIFATDPGADSIYRIEGQTLQLWSHGDALPGVNGIMADGDSLLVGTSADSSLKRIDLASKQISTIARFESGIVDGIQKADTGFLISLYHGELYHVSENSPPQRLLDTRAEQVNCANFLYITSQDLLVVPELRNNSITAYRLAK